MGTLYTTQAVSGLNDDPPDNDGSQVATNLVDWDKHIDEIATPLNNRMTAIDGALVDYVDRAPRNKGVSYPVVATDHLRTIFGTVNGVVITLPVISSVFLGFTVTVKAYVGVGQTVTVRRSGTNTIEGSASDRTLAQFVVETYTAASASSWIITGGYTP